MSSGRPLRAGPVGSHLRVTDNVVRSRDAFLRPSLIHHHHHQATDSFRLASGTAHDPEKCSCGFRKKIMRRRKEAKRRKAHASHFAAYAAAGLSEPARLPALHRGTRQAGRIQHWLSSRTAFPGTARAGVLPASATSPIQPAPGRPVLVPAEQGPGAARERTANPRAGTALAPLSGVPS